MDHLAIEGNRQLTNRVALCIDQRVSLILLLSLLNVRHMARRNHANVKLFYGQCKAAPERSNRL